MEKFTFESAINWEMAKQEVSKKLTENPSLLLFKQKLENPTIKNIDAINSKDIWDIAWELKKFNLSEQSFNSFKNSLINSWIEWINDFVKNISKEDIKNFLIIATMVAPLILSWVWVPAAVWVIWARLWITTVMTRIVTQIMMRPNISSAIMGLIPGMKNIAPNQWLAMTVSELKHILPTAFWFITAKVSWIFKEK